MGAALLALLGTVAPAVAQTGVAGQALSVCVRKDAGGIDPAALIRAPAGFDCTGAQHRWGAGSYWVVSQDIDAPSTATAPWHVRFASLWQGGLTLHILYDDGRVLRIAADERGLTPWLRLGAIADIPLPKKPGHVVRLLWHVERSANVRGILVGARLSSATESNAADLKLAMLYAGFAGLCAALIMYNLALWAALRHRFHLQYCAMGVCLLGYTFSSSGALAWVFPEIVNNDRIRINYLLLGLTGSAALVFARNFFEARVFAGRFGRLFRIASAGPAAIGVIFVLLAPFAIREADALFTGAFVMLAGIILPTLWRAWRMRSNYLWLFAIGWGAPMLTAIARVMANLHLIGWNFWLDNSTMLAMAAEALISALAIAYRMRVLREERDQAITREVMARRLADTDPLTGLLNRRAFLAQAIGRGGEQALMIIDIDHFKQVNETLGHDGGDEVLRLFSRLLRANVPAGALVARLGGEEFAILSDVRAPVEPDALLAKLRAARMPFDLTITASIGTCRGRIDDDRDWKRLYRGADVALYAAKSAGRDRVRHATREAA